MYYYTGSRASSYFKNQCLGILLGTSLGNAHDKALGVLLGTLLSYILGILLCTALG